MINPTSRLQNIINLLLSVLIVKQLDMVITHERLSDVNSVLYSHKVGGMMYYDIRGRGRAERQTVEERLSEAGGYATGRRYVPEFGSRIKIEVLVPDSMYKQIVDDILSKISTGSTSDGKIFVRDISEAYDIGTRQIGEVAL